MIMNDFYKWAYMTAVLQGAKFDQYALQTVAESMVGEVLEKNQYTKLTDRLYEPTVMERFAAM